MMYIFLIVIFVVGLGVILYFDHKGVKNNKKKTLYGAYLLLGGFIARFWLGTKIGEQDLLTPRGIETKAQIESYFPITYLVIIVGFLLIILDNKDKIMSKYVAMNQNKGENIEEKLKQIKSMKDKGLINDEEYETKKKELLDKITK